MQVTIKNKERVLNQFDFLKNRDEDSICNLLIVKIQNGDFEFANKILQYGFDARQVVMNYEHIQALKKFGFSDFTLGEFGWIPHPDWLNVETVEFGDRNYFEIGQGPNGKWTYGCNASNNTSGYGCGLNEYIDPMTKDAAIKEAISELKQWHEKQVSQEWKEEAAKNTSRRILAKIKEYQKPKQAVLF